MVRIVYQEKPKKGYIVQHGEDININKQKKVMSFLVSRRSTLLRWLGSGRCLVKWWEPGAAGRVPGSTGASGAELTSH